MILEEAMSANIRRRLGHVLCEPIEPLSGCTPKQAVVGRWVDGVTQYERGLKILVKELIGVGPVRLSRCGPRGPSKRCSEIIGDMAKCCSQWRLPIRSLSCLWSSNLLPCDWSFTVPRLFLCQANRLCEVAIIPRALWRKVDYWKSETENFGNLIRRLPINCPDSPRTFIIYGTYIYHV